MKRYLKRLKWFAGAAAAVCCVMMTVLPASALRKYEDDFAKSTLYDPDGLFSEDEQMQLSELIRQTSEDVDMNVAVYVINSGDDEMEDDASMRFADDRYDSLFNAAHGEETDGVLLLLNMPTHYMYLSTCGMGQLYYYNGFSDDRVSAMIDNMRSFLQDGDEAGAVQQFCNDVHYYYEVGYPKKGYTYDAQNDQYYWEQNGQLISGAKLPFSYRVNLSFLVPLSLILGAIAAMIASLCVRSSYKLKKSLNPNNYISQKDTAFLQHDDVFIRTHTTKQHIDSDSRGGGSGGGGSSHFSSGGFSHGGGGGHW